MAQQSYAVTSQKKFLDANGLAYFSRQLNNYPSNDLLAAVIDGIGEELDDKIDKTSIDTSISAGSTSTNLPTSQAVAAFVEGKGYLSSVTTATTSANGLMSSTDKTKLDGIDTGATAPVILEYGVSTLQDFLDAYNKNAVIYCKCGLSSPSANPKQRFAVLSYIAISNSNITSVEFQYYRSIANASVSASNVCNQVYIYKLNSSGWSSETREAGALLNSSGDNISVSFDTSNRTYTVNCTLESKTAASGGTNVSLVTTGDKYNWNNKLDANQGSGNAGKFLVVGSTGNIEAVTMTAWQGGSY